MNNQNFKMINCTADMIDALTEFYDEVTEYLDMHTNYPKWRRGDYPSRSSAAAAAAAGVQYACIADGRIAGAFILNDDPQGDYGAGEWTHELERGEYLVIHTLAVRPAMYGSGVGRAMTEYAAELAGRRGYKAVRLDVVPDNIPAKRLYERCGFTFAGEKDLRRGIADIPLFALYELNL